MHYFELMSLSIAMYIKMKQEFRTIEFIELYFSQISVQKSDHPERNHDLFLNAQTEPILVPKMKQKYNESSVRLDSPGKVKLSEIFLKDGNYQIIQQCLTCSNASVSVRIYKSKLVYIVRQKL
jgi:hypothetical protein